MTPWGIRKKIKTALGLGEKASSAAEQVSLKIELPSGSVHTIQCEPGYTLVMASQTLETPIATHCPDGHCGECVVEVESATGLKAPSSAEAGLLRAKGYPENARLACHARVAESGAYIKVKQTWSMDQVRGT